MGRNEVPKVVEGSNETEKGRNEVEGRNEAPTAAEASNKAAEGSDEAEEGEVSCVRGCHG